MAHDPVTIRDLESDADKLSKRHFRHIKNDRL